MSDRSFPLPSLIAHAGGGVHGRAYVNSREALDHNYALGHRFFELDFCWTADGELVAIHDWEGTWRALFPGARHDRAPTRAEFLAAAMLDGDTPLDLARLRAWLAGHPDAWIVTDVRGRNLEALQKMRRELGPEAERLIPQLYHPHTWADIRALGYSRVIFTLYATSLGSDALLDFIRGAALFAVTVDPSRPDAERIIAETGKAGIPVYVHTFNETTDFERFRAMGVHGLYTDFLHPGPDGEILRQ